MDFQSGIWGRDHCDEVCWDQYVSPRIHTDIHPVDHTRNSVTVPGDMGAKQYDNPCIPVHMQPESFDILLQITLNIENDLWWNAV